MINYKYSIFLTIPTRICVLAVKSTMNGERRKVIQWEMESNFLNVLLSNRRKFIKVKREWDGSHIVNEDDLLREWTVSRVCLSEIIKSCWFLLNFILEQRFAMLTSLYSQSMGKEYPHSVAARKRDEFPPTMTQRKYRVFDGLPLPSADSDWTNEFGMKTLSWMKVVR